jgi:hypothetical protein
MEGIRALRSEIIERLSELLESQSPGEVRMRFSKLTYPDLVWLKEALVAAVFPEDKEEHSGAGKGSNPADAYLPESDVRCLEWLHDAILFLVPSDALIGKEYGVTPTLRVRFRLADGRTPGFVIRIERARGE